MNISAVIKEGVSVLGNDRLLDVELIVAHVLNVDKNFLFLNPDKEVHENELFLVRKNLDYLKKGRPVAYILKFKEFYSHGFFVDERVLIPRPETEQVVDIANEYLRQVLARKMQVKVVDVGTGSACIAVSIARAFDGENVYVDALDYSYEALEVANINVMQHSVEDRVAVFHSDLLEVVDDGEMIDVIVANLPYIGKKKHDQVDKNVDAYEPSVALYAGDDGLLLYEDMFRQIEEKNIKFGMIVAEFGESQRDDMAELLEGYFPGKWEIKKDLAGLSRIFVVKA